jgi:predicted Zn-dependent peptidase
VKIFTHKTTNNYKVLHVKHESPIALIMFFVRNGSRFETTENLGISHFLEHMMFKATSNRKTSKEINSEIESIGGMTNAFTSNEYTGYYIQVLKENFDHAFDILSDLIENGVLEPSTIELEKGVVIEEIRMYEDSPMDKVFEIAQENIFANQQLGLPIIGTEETVKSITQEKLKNFINSNYRQDDFLVVTVGDFEMKRTVENVEKSLKPRPTGSLSFEKAVFNPAQKVNFINKNDINQAHTVISFPGVSMFDKDIYKVTLLETVLGKGMGSILFDLLREQLGVAYYVYASSQEYLDTGAFHIPFGANFDKAKETVERIFDELEKLKKQVITEDELMRAKNFIYSMIAMKHESVSYLGQKYGIDYLLRNEIEEIEDIRKEIFNITTKDIMETANKIFVDKYNITYIANKPLL